MRQRKVLKERHQQGVKTCWRNWYIPSQRAPPHTLSMWWSPQDAPHCRGGCSVWGGVQPRPPGKPIFPVPWSSRWGCAHPFSLGRKPLSSSGPSLPSKPLCDSATPIGILSSLPWRKAFPSKQSESLSFGPEGSFRQSCCQAGRALEADRPWMELQGNFCLAVLGPHQAGAHSLLPLGNWP